MCGIAGFTFESAAAADERRTRFGPSLARMTAALRHRGPDAQRGLLLDGVALGHARLAIVDLAGGAQPMRDPETGMTVVFNGEIFNHRELREELAGRYRFRTRSDTEVLLASLVLRGEAALHTLNGQFAFAAWDPRTRALLLARDRAGICPLYFARTAGGLAFASEAKALFAGGQVAPALDFTALAQTLELWSPVEGRSAFAGVEALPPRTLARFQDGELTLRRYWDLDLSDARVEPGSAAHAEAEVEALLGDAVRLRLRADVPVAAYLSGGLDSSLLCAMARSEVGGGLRTYSLTFADRSYDERDAQGTMVGALGTRHRQSGVDQRAVAELLPRAVWHSEQLLVRAAPAPLLHLSGAVQAEGIKVVLTGEGADEVFWGYDLYKETAVRQFWARSPGSRLRPALLARLYPWLAGAPRSAALLADIFGPGIDSPTDLGFSHRIRWRAGARQLRLLAPELAASLAHEDPAEALLATLPPQVSGWRPLARAQYLEMQTFLAGYLLCAQGDRMLLANGVEGRFPFLDHRLIERAARLPDRLKLAGLCEKKLLRRVAQRWIPQAVAARQKFPYRAPAAAGLVGAGAAAWARELLSPEEIRRTGIFDPVQVQRLVKKLAESDCPTESDGSAVVAVATGQLLAQQFATAACPPEAAVEAVALEVA